MKKIKNFTGVKNKLIKMLNEDLRVINEECNCQNENENEMK